jgi:hypothetical protein
MVDQRHSVVIALHAAGVDICNADAHASQADCGNGRAVAAEFSILQATPPSNKLWR